MTGVLRHASALLLIVASWAAAADTPASFYAAYAKPGRLVALQDGRKIHMVCAGTGSPTVIFTAGFSDWSAQWGAVFAPIAAKTRACSWDRAGYGFSDPSPLPQDVVHTTADLEGALNTAGIAGPYVMVGHSMGGFESLLFTDRHRSQVAGMVLVDPSIPDQARRIKAAAPAFAAASRKGELQYIQKKKSCAAKIKSGVLATSSPDPDNCFSYNDDYSTDLVAALRQMDADPARWLTRASAMEQLNRNAEEAVNPKRNYGDLPLRVLTSSDLGPLPPSYGAATLAQAPAFQAAFQRGHDELAALSTKGTDTVVPGTTHYIHFIKPDVVISAISQVIDEAREAGR